MKKIVHFALSTLFAFALLFTTCDSTGDGGSNISDVRPNVTFSNVNANGSTTQTTTGLILTFSEAIPGLTENDIALSGVSGVQKGTLSGTGPTYTLPISGFIAGGTLTVAVAKTGFNITNPSRTVAIHFSTPPTTVAFSNITADGSATQTTTQLTLSFSQVIPGLNADDITLSHSVSGQTVTKGTLSGMGSTYTLPISGFTAGGNLSVSIIKPGFNISNSPRTIPIFREPSTVAFSNVTANNPTTVLTLTFNQAIPGLHADDITLSGVSGVQKGTLSGTGPTYTLPISGFTTGGSLNITVTKSGFSIIGSPRTVTIFGPLPDAPTNVTATVEATARIRVNWSAVSGAHSYAVHISTSASGGFAHAIASSTTSAMLDLSPATTYYIIVYADNSTGRGPPSSPISVTTNAMVPGTGGNIVGTWGMDNGFIRYVFTTGGTFRVFVGSELRNEGNYAVNGGLLSMVRNPQNNYNPNFTHNFNQSYSVTGDTLTIVSAHGVTTILTRL